MKYNYLHIHKTLKPPSTELMVDRIVSNVSSNQRMLLIKRYSHIKENGNGIQVEVGDVHHPMEEKHYIKFIEVLTKDKVIRAELAPNEAPVADFPVNKSDVVEVRRYCNLHGLWVTE